MLEVSAKNNVSFDSQWVEVEAEKVFGELEKTAWLGKKSLLFSCSQFVSIVLPKEIWRKFRDLKIVRFPVRRTRFWKKGVAFFHFGRMEKNKCTFKKCKRIASRYFFQKDKKYIDFAIERSKLHEDCRFVSTKRRIENYLNHGHQILIELINQSEIEKGCAHSYCNKKDLLSLELWRELKARIVSHLDGYKKLFLSPYFFHLDWIVSQIDHEIELRAFDFTQTIPVKDQKGKEVAAQVKLGSGYFYFGYENKICLLFQNRKIGSVEFIFNKDCRNIFIVRIQNKTISCGKREFSGVGTGLLNLVKKICSAFNYKFISLTAQVLLHVPKPKNNNLLSFYEKNDFFRSGNGDSLYRGIRMRWYQPAVQFLEFP